MPNVTLRVELSAQLQQLASQVQQQLSQGMPLALAHIRDTWVQAVSGVQLPGMDQAVDAPAYAAALMRPDAIDYPVDGDELHGRVLMLDPEIARQIEQSRPARDMKPALLHGPKARRNKKGQLYNVIPLGLNEDLWFQGIDYRTVSEKSRPGSWIYPAKIGIPVVASVRAVEMPVVMQILSNMVQEWRA